MANATITAPTGTQVGNFTVGITFDVGIIDFTASKLSVTAVSGNGITGLKFAILPDTDMNSATYNVSFELPEDVIGALQIAISGMVTRVGGSQPEGVMANALTVTYNNITNVTVAFGTVVYRDDGVIVVPVTFGENVIADAKSIFSITRVSGDTLEGVRYALIGENTDYELIFQVPPDRSGSFRITADGDVFKTGTQIWDNMIVSPKTLSYNTAVPKVKTYDIPEAYVHGEVFDVIFEFDTDCTVNNPIAFFGDLNATYLDFFIFEGADLGNPPNLYRKVDDVFPMLPLPASLGNDWTQTDLQTTEATLYLLRWNAVNAAAEGIFNITMKPGFVRGPVRLPIVGPTGDYIDDGDGNYVTDGNDNYIGRS